MHLAGVSVGGWWDNCRGGRLGDSGGSGGLGGWRRSGLLSRGVGVAKSLAKGGWQWSSRLVSSRSGVVVWVCVWWCGVGVWCVWWSGVLWGGVVWGNHTYHIMYDSHQKIRIHDQKTIDKTS